MRIFEYLKTVIEESNCDFLYVNHTNKFFSEYVDVKRSSRFLLTKFSGSCGDALVSKEKIYLFADSRYWEQAELEVDKKITEIVKIGTGYSLLNALCEIVPRESKILLFQDNTSFFQYENMEKMGFRPVLSKKDYITDFFELKPLKLVPDFKIIPQSISGRRKEQKIKKLQNKLKDNEVLIISSLEDVSYLLNLKSDTFEYSSVAFGKILIKKNDYDFYTDDNMFEKALKQYKNAKFFIDKHSLSIKYKKYFKEYEQAKFLQTLRSVKYQTEINHMKKCEHH